MYTKQIHGYRIKEKPFPILDKWSLLRLLGKDKLSLAAQLKLEWIIFYQAIGKGNARLTAKHFGINPKTLHKWKGRFNEKYLSTLEEKSRAPERTRQREISILQKKRIRDLRNAHLRWGKMKLKERYKEIYGEDISSWKFQVVIEDEHLYYDRKKALKQRKRRKQLQENPKKRIHTLLKESKTNYLWHVDTVIFTLFEGGYRYLLTAIDDYSKLAYARLYTTHSSKQATDFLRRLHYLTEGEIINLHHDNGSEFQKDFEKACLELSLPQWYSRVRTPKDNAVLERFNRTIQEEFVEMTEQDPLFIPDFNNALTEWLIEYNYHRPHQALDYKSPLVYLDSYYGTSVSTMYSSHTSA